MIIDPCFHVIESMPTASAGAARLAHHHVGIERLVCVAIVRRRILIDVGLVHATAGFEVLATAPRRPGVWVSVDPVRCVRLAGNICFSPHHVGGEAEQVAAGKA